MSRRACETCAWFAAGEYEHGICAYIDHVTPYTAKHYDMPPIDAAKRIRMGDDTCEHWDCEVDVDES